MAEIYRAEIPSGILYAPIALAASGTLVFGVPSRSIVLVSAWMVASAAVNAKFQSSTGPTDLTGLSYTAQNGGFVLPFNPGGWARTAPGDSLLLALSGSIPVGGSISYILA